MKLRALEHLFSVFLAFVSLGVFFSYGVEYAIYVMCWALIMNIPPDYKLMDDLMRARKRIRRKKGGAR